MLLSLTGGKENAMSKALTKKKKKRHWLIEDLTKHYQLLILLLPAFALVVVFNYVPMYGILLAFKDYRAVDGIWGSEWVGFEHFERFFSSYYFTTVIKNTLIISISTIIIGFILPIVFALMLNEIKYSPFKKFVQTVTYAPHFISVTVLVGMLFAFLSPTSGVVNTIIEAFGGDPIAFMQEPKWFLPVYLISEQWQNLGWGSIIYIAVLSSVDMELHEAATIDGASRLQRIWYINLPCIKPTAMIMLIMSTGSVLGVGFEKIYLMQTPLNLSVSEVISTYVYKIGLVNSQYEFSTAVGLFTSVISMIILLIVNAISKKVGEQSLW